MAKVAAQRAAELTGRSKSTIQRAMKTGKISFEVEEGGRRVIDVAELERAFGLLPQGEQAAQSAEDVLETERLKGTIRVLESQLEAAREQITDLKVQRDMWQKQAQQVLLSNQYTQKQAEDLKEEIKERDRRAKARRQHEITQRMNSLKGGNQNTPVSAGAAKAASLWQKILGAKAA
ncbi:MAG TPA: entry exclusion 1 domain-containing protein [Patescibacteria group bacterium]|jgi:predicted  nucleic acid-binding Zn-ribbon protein|nr:entry exclusion 1 domain-containing protein [Patescibacteria group bacterium]